MAAARKYEGLFILDIAGKEESIKDIIDKVTNEITAGGGKIETVQKMEKKPFARVSNKKYTSGFYVNVIFEVEPGKLAALKNRFTLNPDVFRVTFNHASENALAEAAK
jgi:small subunit ribosomal protein S6